MKKLVLAFFMLIYLTTTAFALKNEPIGFRGIKWNDPISKHADVMILDGVDDSGTVKTYKRRGDKPYLGNTFIGPVYYQFDKIGFIDAAFYISYTEGSPYNDVKSPTELQEKLNSLYNTCVKQWGVPQKTVAQPPKAKPNKKIIYTWNFHKASATLSLYSGIINRASPLKGKHEEMLTFNVSSIDGLTRTSENILKLNSDF